MIMKKYPLIISTILIIFLFLKLFFNYTDRFEEFEKNYSSDPKSAVNLVKGISVGELSDVLYNHNYINNKEDADFVSKFICQKLEEGETLTTLYDLNKRIWQIPVSLIDSIGTNTYKIEADSSKVSIGNDIYFNGLDIQSLTSEINIEPNECGIIKVTVQEEIEDSDEKRACANVVVRLSEQSIDSLDNYKSKRKTIAYLKTNNQGQVTFKGLNPKLSYSVLPIKEGFEYGMSQGTIGGNLSISAENKRSLIDKLLRRNKHTLHCSFNQQEHKIRIFDELTLKHIKEDQTLTIRSPKEFKNIMVKYVVLFFASWWGLWLFSRARKKTIDIRMLSILMTLTGLCLLAMFSLNNPLTDRLLGVDMGQGIIGGVVLIGILINVNIKRLYQNQSLIGFDIPLECVKWIFKPFKFIVIYLTRLFDRLPKGFGYLLTALVLTVLLFPFGHEVGGMKVNLVFGGLKFQPSEIAKYLITFFMAAYFSGNANKIVQYSEKGNSKLFGAKLKMMMSIFIGLGLLMGLYLVLGDMGPALVLAFTFIILYSIIKSKVDLAGITTENQLKNIFTCDFAMLIYGVISFVLFLYIGNSLDNMAIFCIAWFVVWIIWGLKKQQIHETPVFFNFIVAAFIFGGSILSTMPGLDSVANRLDSRIEMSVNTWGTLPVDGKDQNAGENTQVAEGLWGLASGGLWGQGLGNGSPHFIPAFHTDMILESIGEQMGFVGIFIIVLLLAILLRSTIVVGYKSYHPFTFYLCLGIAIVTAIQFIIITLGSTGIIPLTGVTVPFFSHGRVSMILNLAAYGIILSIASHSSAETMKFNDATANLIKQNIGKYNYSISLLSWAYCIIAIFICGVFFYYQFIDRNDTLIRPVYVNNSNGIPVIEYNPRIIQLTQKMYSGDIYDRKGVLLATSDALRIDEKSDSLYRKLLGNEYNLDLKKRQLRYYPFGKHLTFMLGDRNSNLFALNGSESSGYVAEIRHLSELRGYNPRLDVNGKECPTVVLSTDSMQIDRWHSANYKYKDTIKLLKYTALIPYLKSGVNSDRIRDFNNRDESWLNIGKIKPKDIHLTIDVELQTKLQKGMKEFVEEICTDEQYRTIKGFEKFKKYRNLMRASVVVLDAENGDLLASANYPLPSSERLTDEIVEKNGKKQLPNYSDAGKVNSNWTSYTDVDLGLFYATAPGSTAKVMSSLAGLRKCGTNVADPGNNNYSYSVLESQKVGDEPIGRINMRRAIVESSNCYFINLINDYGLYDELFDIYRNAGITINGKKPYSLFYSDSTNVSEFNESFYGHNIEGAITKYRKYVENNDIKPMQDGVWQWTWGQGDLDATPLSMARVASIVANAGVMPTTRYTIEDESYDIPVVKAAEAQLLGRFMIEEAETHGVRIESDNNVIGGKTGTANRDYKVDGRTENRSNDAWYICYVKKKSNPSQRPIAIAVRIERGQTSTFAKLLVKKKVKKALTDCGYIFKDDNI